MRQEIPEIISRRLISQQIAETKFTQPAKLVQWMTAMQAQEYAHAKWAIGLRLPGSTDTMVEQAFNNGEILRTHLLRPTWHFVSPDDIHWLLTLTAPQVQKLNAYYYKKFALDGKTFARCNDILFSLLEGKNHMNRSTLQVELKKRKIFAEGLRLAYLFMNAELEGIICSGPRQGKQFSYALLEEQAPVAKKFHRKESLLSFACRYFATRGPATANDFSYWSGISMKEVNEAIENLPREFLKEKIEGQEYIYQDRNESLNRKSVGSFLLPTYDEYGMSYRNRDIYLRKYSGRSIPPNLLYGQPIIINGYFGGSWQRLMNGTSLLVKTDIHPAFNTRTNHLLVNKAVNKYISFHS